MSVQPPAPTLVDATCDEVTTIAVPPDTRDYTYSWPHPEGDRWMAPGETETITVTPAPGVTLIPPTSWTFTGQPAPDCTVPSPELPHTGLNAVLAVAGIALLGAGIVLLVSMKEW